VSLALRAGFGLAVCLVLAPPASAARFDTTLVSRVSGGGLVGNDSSGPAALSADGAHVAFESDADNLSSEDDNSVTNVFVRDLQTGQTVLVSRAGGASGAAGNGSSSDAVSGAFADNGTYGPAISADGRYVAFASRATNLTTNDNNGAPDVFVRDTVANTTTLVSAKPGGGVGHSYEWDDNTQAYTLVNDVYSYAGRPSISGDGRYVAFESHTDDISSADDNDDPNVFVRDTVTGTTVTLSPRMPGLDEYSSGNHSGGAMPVISTDGSAIAFVSDDDFTTGLDDAARHVVVTGRSGGSRTTLALPAGEDAFLPAISGDGNLVALYSNAAGTLNIYRQARTGAAELVSRADGASGAVQNFSADYRRRVSLSGDGRYVAFGSKATNLTADDTDADTDVFVRDMQGGTTTLVSRAAGAAGAKAVGQSNGGSLSSDATEISFDTDDDLTLDDTNGAGDVYARQLLAQPPVNTVAPVISAPQGFDVGSTITCSPGSWNRSPSAFAFQWLRNGVAIPGETQSSYTLTTADVGALLTCAVIATNGEGTSSASSAPASANQPATQPVPGCVQVGFACLPPLPRDDSITPVIFLPGISGSDMTCDDFLGPKELWPHLGIAAPDRYDLLDTAANVLEIGLDSKLQIAKGLVAQSPRLPELRLAADGVSPFDPSDDCNNSARPTGNETRGIPLAIATVKDVYGDSGDFVRAAGQGRGFVFGYDWRKSPGLAADALDQYIDRVLEYTQSDKVALFTHSMGGIVARWYVDDAARAAKVARVVSVAPPYWGTPKGWFPLSNGTETLGSLFSEMDLFIVNDDMKALSQNMTSLYFLMPGRAWQQRIGPWLRIDAGNFSGKTIGLDERATIDEMTVFKGNRALADQAVADMARHIDGFHVNGVPYNVIAGSGVPTIGEITEAASGLRDLTTVDWINGDGSAPLVSEVQNARGANADRAVQAGYLCGIGHIEQTGNKALQNELQDYLFQSHQPGTGLPVSLPISGTGLIKRAPCRLSGLAADVSGLLGSGNAARFSAAGGALSLAEAEHRGLVLVVTLAPTRHVIVSLTSRKVKLALRGSGLTVSVTRLREGADKPIGDFVLGSGAAQLALSPQGPRVRAHGHDLRKRAHDRTPPRTKARAHRRGSRTTLTLRAGDASGIRAIYVRVGRAPYRRVGRTVKVATRKLRSVRFFSVDLFGNAERPQRLR
jgi:Tol biopolymer transport system component/pimeloyl-ACP methyl ester carboxylesterase